MSFKNKTIAEFSEELASAAAVPGGGGAAALLASLAASLTSMVANLTKGKKYEAVAEEVQAEVVKLEALRLRFLQMIDEDAVAFEPLSKAYSLPRSTEEELQYRDAIMANALQEAAAAPLELMRVTAELIDHIELMSRIGSRIAISDAGVAASFAKAVLESALLNVYINTKLMKDRSAAAAMNAKADEYATKAELAAEILASVCSGLKN